MTNDITTAAPAVRIEHHDEPEALGIGDERPRLSWQLATAPADYRQLAYEVSWRTRTPTGAVADEGVAVVTSSDQLFVPWPGAPLAPRARTTVRVRTQDASTGTWGALSEPVVAERGLSVDDWRAELVGPDYLEGPEDDRRAPLVRTDFRLDSLVQSARLHVTAHGLVEVEINGSRVGADELLPGWTPYHERLRVYTYDVTTLVRSGENAIGAWLADGWFRGRFGFEGGTTDIYGSRIGVLAQLEAVLEDGRTVVVASDGTWRSTPGPLTRASLYDGERIDLRLLPEGWSQPGFDDASWTPVAVLPLDKGVLSAPDGPAVRCTGEILPVSVTAVDDGWLLDYGQNHSGRPRLTVPPTVPGTHITIQHAEVLQDGRLYRRPLRQAASTDEIVTAGEAVVWEPRFTVHGYRYAFVQGWPGEQPPAEGAIVSRVLHSDMRRTGWFTSDNAGLNRLHENVVWGLRSNFVDIPTDCPQRDERLGWTGDIQVFAPTASFLYDVHGVLSDWLRSLTIEQKRFGGTVPVYVPWVPGGVFWRPEMDVAGWGDAAAIVPEALHTAFGDRDLLERQYDSARTWVERVATLAGPSRLWDEGLQLGDWLDPAAPPDNPMQAMTDPHLVATAYFARSTDALSGIAAALGRDEDAARYGELAAEIRAAFVARYVDTDDPTHDTPCAHSLAISFGLLEDAATRARAGNRLDELVRSRGYTVSTGFAGTPVVTDALSRTGHLDTAYRLLLSHEAPSWLATIDLGATTIWERWDSMLPDGTVNPGDMTSFNHYALGSVADWIHRTVGGLAPTAAAYRELRVAPRPGVGVTSAAVRHLTPFGEATAQWELRDGELAVQFSVPVGTTAVVDLPGRAPYRVGHGTHRATVAFEASRGRHAV
ncbi:alpha-L-rhamnosidase [Cellulomonas fimi]|uniref:alpha-L-rhamnosidase n=1 Tax=Cellulomonas fimi (strain ATCC 484 / DSM 20113 / JCM 1341 / CCUG 24087 / LMG 16345 / NBRC 15513 / NCIMB 8980 / NCTC 7547 / NRS-133) TaxID=590998 RepID=F4GYI2_CELFA|nr:alpha-L-rhamnosidase [Cellulomonas fimi]AEE47099.1 alpha-L-rhamnosidase [Cellulomonas fimi ATCC 484]NNH07330.1 family 78 glycoside hydrolase catalytic domain [Cellulomonas fimi]VEH35243.1 Bacterial alpha-L-rhamnosidase [Cellulomonas fimi]